MNYFSFQETGIVGLHVIERTRSDDSRGFLERLFCLETLTPFLKGKIIRQINRTLTRKKGTVRGLHFQYQPHGETKIVTCLKGKVWDVVVDLRKGSSTFLKVYTIELSEENQKSFLIPEGFAHGFQTLTSDCELLYFHTADYFAEAEGGIDALDPNLAINWPKPITERSIRDSRHNILTNEFLGLDY